jgi:hypothetical protein
MNTLQFWFYLSSSALARTEWEVHIQQIVNVSKRRNAESHVTGALMFSGDHFLQHIEGPAASVAQIKASILDDPRHVQIRTLGEGALQTRAFGGWALAYGGRSQFVESAIAKSLKRFESRDAASDDFLRLLKVFA